MSEDPKRELLRHTLATLAYRGGKALRNAPETFASFRVASDVRSPSEILAHIGDVLDWGLSIAQGKQTWRSSTPLPWNDELTRFFAGLQAFDAYLVSGEALHETAEKLFQGPIADAFSHVGQIAILRRVAGAQIRGENYFVAEVNAGCVGPEQAAARREFD
jgi:hypothetical protein